MRSRRTLAFWLALALCAATVLGAMTWLTRGVLAAERARLTAQRDRAAAEARADLEERTRLALWRMDALGAAIVLRENLVPRDDYRAKGSDPVAGAGEPEVLLRFELGQNLALTASVATSAGTAADRVKRLQALLRANPPSCNEWTTGLQGQLPISNQPGPQSFDNALQRRVVPSDQLRKDAVYQQQSNVNERNLRAKAVEQTITGNKAQADSIAALEEPSAARELQGGLRGVPQSPAPAGAAQALAVRDAKDQDASPRPAAAPMAEVAKRAEAKREGTAAPVPASPTDMEQAGPVPTKDLVGQMRATWLGGELFLIRKVTSRVERSLPGGGSSEWNTLFSTTVLQGVWLDSRVLTANLLREVADLLPQARLVPAVDEHAAADPLALVSFPFKLERGETPLATAITTEPTVGAPLWVAWGGVLVAVLTIALLLRGVLRLSERRASFVSAVTHELRTPLTTFRLYSDMLEQDAVKPEKRGSYLRVLSREADRLSHLVENVLAFSRIERGNARSNVRESGVAELLEACRERCEARLATAGLAFAIQAPPDLRMRADLAAVEHILFNLIDNAAKYAARGEPPLVEITARAAGSGVEIAVADHGPGIARDERRRVFQPFHKSAREAAESQPGVGLGLALSRRLARAQGGDLTIAEAVSGACFVLRLPGGGDRTRAPES